MANADTPFGFKWIGNLNGSQFVGGTVKCNIPATDGTATFVNDAVKIAGSADADGVMTVNQATAGAAVYGVVTSVHMETQDSLVYRAASTNRYVYVKPVMEGDLFEVQEDSVGGALAATSVGLNADIIVAAGSTTTGLSAMELDSSTAATTATLDLHIHSVVVRPDNAIGTNAKLIVTFNNRQTANQVAGV